MIRAILFASLAFIASCATVTIKPKGPDYEVNTNPSYSRSESFFLWGLAGESNIDVKEICGDRDVTQMQTFFSVGNQLAFAFTLGFYAPTTAEVWCEKRSASQTTETPAKQNKWQGDNNASF